MLKVGSGSEVECLACLIHGLANINGPSLKLEAKHLQGTENKNTRAKHKCKEQAPDTRNEVSEHASRHASSSSSVI